MNEEDEYKEGSYSSAAQVGVREEYRRDSTQTNLLV